MDCMETRGYSLAELIITLAIGAILLGVAAPAFTDLIRSSRLSAELNVFVRSVNYGRTEAIKRAHMVIICARNGRTCDNSAPWRDGWLVFVDQDGDGEPDPEELIMTFTMVCRRAIVSRRM